MENHSETINNENKEIKKKVFDKFDKVFDKDFIELENTKEDLFKKNLENLLYINEDLFKEKDKLRKKIYEKIDEKIIYLRDCSLDQDEHFLFEKAKSFFEKNENEDEYKKIRKIINKYHDLNNLTRSIKFYTNSIKNPS